jgi:hypothetical protein
MIEVHPQYVIDETSTQQAVIIQINEWNNIVEKLEMLDDAEAYDNEKQYPSKIISFDQAVKEIKEGKNFEV